MRHTGRDSLGVLALAAVLSTAATASLAQPATPNRLGQAFRGAPSSQARPAPPAARYVADGVAEFTFDNSTGLPMLRFDGTSEIVALNPTRAAGGVIIYKNDLGEPVLRAPRVGGMTVFTSAHPEGSPARMIGAAPTIRLEPILNFGVRMIQASDRIRTALGKRVVIDTATNPEAGSLLVDVLNLTADAILRIKGSRDPALATINNIEVTEGERPTVDLQESTLAITVSPKMGVAGRPSSARIAREISR